MLCSRPGLLGLPLFRQPRELDMRISNTLLYHSNTFAMEPLSCAASMIAVIQLMGSIVTISSFNEVAWRQHI
jgi:hypothetical protein